MNTQSTNALSPDLASLIHHVELSKAGWRDEAFKILLLSIMERHDESLSINALCKLVNEAVPATVSQTQIERFLDKLMSSQQLFKLPNGYYKLSEQAREQCILRARSDKSLTDAAKQRFEDSFKSIDDDSLGWESFRRDFLIPLVSDLGARTYELVTGDEVAIHGVPAYQRFISSLPGTHRSALSNGFGKFFDPSSVETRQYMLRLLNNAFLTQAIALPDRAMKALLDRTRQPFRVRVFVDTNFLFSLLGLHDNPADDVVRALHDVMGQMSGRIDVKFYILPFTVDEAQGTLAQKSDRLSQFHMSREVARVINSTNSGIVSTYARKAYSGGKRVSAKDYFAPYLSDFIRVARDFGIELFNADVQDLNTDDDVISDVEEQMERQKQWPNRRQKSYEVMCHDMKLWHFVRSRRPPRVDSPLDAEAWIATLDYALLGFDAAKRGKREPPVCIHPTSLLQILQLWVPSSDLLVSALMESLRPMLPRTFDYEAEEISIRIASVLSRFEDDTLTEEAVSDIMLNEAVRERVGATTDKAEDVKIIESEVAKTNKKLVMRLDDSKVQVERAQGQAERAQGKVVALERERDRERQEKEKLRSQVSVLVETAETERAAMQKQVESVQQKVDDARRKERERERRTKQRRARRRTVVVAVVAGAVTMIAGLYGWWQLIEKIYDVGWIQRLGLGAVVATGSIGVTGSVVRKRLGRAVTDDDSWWIAWITGWGERGARAFWFVVGGVTVVTLASLFS